MMLQASFSINNSFKLNGTKYVVRTMNDDGSVLLESEPNNFTNTTLEKLLTSYCHGSLTFNINNDPIFIEKKKNGTSCTKRKLSDFSPATQDQSLRAHRYLKTLLDSAPISIDRAGIIDERIADVALQFGDPKPPHKTTIFRWYQKYLASGGDKYSLIYHFENRGGKGQRRCTEKEAKIEDELIDDLFLTERGCSLEDLTKQMDLICQRENEWLIPKNKLHPRSTSSFRRRIAQYDPFAVIAAREGVDTARRKFRANGIVPPTKARLQIVEIDHTPFDLFVIDSKHGIPMGRPTLTMAICRATKMPWGLNIGFDDCSADAVLACIENGVKPKIYVKDNFPLIKGEWPVYGIPAELRCDNGLEFHSDALQNVALDLGFELAFCPKRQPNWKGSIEAFFKTFNYQFVHKLPGTSLAKYYQRKGYDPLKAAVIDIDDLNRIVHLWLIDIYMNDLHRSLGCSPRQAWNRGDK